MPGACMHKLMLYTRSACAKSTSQAVVFGLLESHLESWIAAMLCLCATVSSKVGVAAAAKDEERQ